MGWLETFYTVNKAYHCCRNDYNYQFDDQKLNHKLLPNTGLSRNLKAMRPHDTVILIKLGHFIFCWYLCWYFSNLKSVEAAFMRVSRQSSIPVRVPIDRFKKSHLLKITLSSSPRQAKHSLASALGQPLKDESGRLEKRLNPHQSRQKNRALLKRCVVRTF